VAVTTIIILAAMMAVTAMPVEGRGGWRPGKWTGGESGCGGLSPPTPLPPRQLALVVAVTMARSAAAVVVVVVAVTTVAVASGRWSGSGRGGQ
jgi:hypothetical protein